MYSDNKQIRDVADVAARIMAGLPPIQEELKGGQTKLDVDKDGDIQADDLTDLRAKKKVKKEEVEQIEEDELGKKKKEQVVTVKHKDSGKELRVVKPAVADYQKRGYHPVKEEIEELDEVKMADLPSTKVQGRSYGSSKPQPSAFDVLKGPKNKELAAIDAEKKKKKISEMIAIYKEGGLKTFFESIKKEDLIIEEPDSEQFAKDLEDQKKRAAGTKPQADVAKASVQAVKQEAVEQDIYVIDADLANGVDQVDIEERHMTGGEMNKREDIVKSMKKGMPGFKERYGDRAKNVMYATATKQAMKD
jgi:hypothetical protein